MGKPSKVRKVKIALGSNYVPPRGFKFEGSGNWKAKSQQRGNITDFPPGTGEDPAAPGLGRRRHESRLFVTINPNKGGGSKKKGTLLLNDTVVFNAVKHLVTELGRDNNLRQLISFGPVQKVPGGQDYRTDTYDTHVESVEVAAAVERGDVMERPHCHIYLTMIHYSQIQIDKTLLKEWAWNTYNQYCDQAGGSSYKLTSKQSVYTHIKLLPQSDWQDVMMAYMEKGMLT